MKRKVICLLLALSVLLCACPALATGLYAIPEVTLETKFQKQMEKGNGFRGTLSVDMSDAPISGVNAADWAMLRGVLPALSLDFGYIRREDGTRSQLALTLLSGENEAATALFQEDESLLLCQTSLLSKTLLYGVQSGTSLAALFSDAQAADGWPPLWRALFAVTTAGETWKKQLDEYTAPYMTNLSVWMNAYVKTGVTRDASGNTQTAMRFNIPASAVKQQLKALLANVYQDSALRTHLAQVFTARETAAYLQPSMSGAVYAMIDALEMTGNLVIERVYTLTGQLVSDKVTLPFAKGQKLSYLSVSQETVNGLAAYTVQGALASSGDDREDATFALSLNQTQTQEENAKIFTGRFSYTPEHGAFDVESAKEIACAFNLFYDPGKETFSQETAIAEKNIEVTLMLTPETGLEGVNAQSLSLKCRLYSGSSNTSAVRIVADLVWSDLVTEASAGLSLNARTASRWNIPDIDASSVLRMDQMPDATLAALLQTLKDNAKTLFAKLLSEMFIVTQTDPQG